MASIGKPVWAPSAPSSGNNTRQAKPMMNMRIMNGVCQTKNQTMACFRAASSFSVITRDTTWGWPATPRPPRKKAAIHRLAPNFKPDGKTLTIAGSIEDN